MCARRWPEPWRAGGGATPDAASPVYADGLVFLANNVGAVTCVDAETGKEVWRTKRRDYRGWSTPILVDTGKRRELVINGHEGVQAYDPANGRDLWFCKSTVGRGEPTITPEIGRAHV